MAGLSYNDDAPVIDHPWVFSPSQIETFRLCQRKWAFRYIDKVIDPPNASAALGTEIHDLLEKYLKFAKPISDKTKAAGIAIFATQHLPMPMTQGMRVEEWFHVPVGDAMVRGKKDFEILDPLHTHFWQKNRHLWPHDADGSPLVGDHKSTGSFMWAKTALDLQTNTQSGIYAFDAHKKTGANKVSLLWNYMRTSGANACQPVRTVIHLPAIQRVVDEAAVTTSQMIEAHKKYERALEVPSTDSACGAFGGCPRRKSCGKTSGGVLLAMISQANVAQAKTNNMMEDLKRRKEEKAAKAAAAKGAPKQTSIVTTTAEVVPDKAAEVVQASGNGSAILPPESVEALQVTAREETAEALSKPDPEPEKESTTTKKGSKSGPKALAQRDGGAAAKTTSTAESRAFSGRCISAKIQEDGSFLITLEVKGKPSFSVGDSYNFAD